jgi:hypothetical protein
MSVSVLVALGAEGYEILGRVISQPAPWLIVMDLKILHVPARLTTPAISLQDFAATLEIKFRSISHRPVPTLSNCEQYLQNLSSSSTIVL